VPGSTAVDLVHLLFVYATAAIRSRREHPRANPIARFGSRQDDWNPYSLVGCVWGGGPADLRVCCNHKPSTARSEISLSLIFGARSELAIRSPRRCAWSHLGSLKACCTPRHATRVVLVMIGRQWSELTINVFSLTIRRYCAHVWGRRHGHNSFVRPAEVYERRQPWRISSLRCPLPPVTKCAPANASHD
jgi:hypothetical protein